MKKIPTGKILDKLHRGVVVACIGLTLYGTAIIGNRVYRYFSLMKPQRELEDLKMLEVRNCEIFCFKVLKTSGQLFYFVGEHNGCRSNSDG